MHVDELHKWRMAHLENVEAMLKNVVDAYMIPLDEVERRCVMQTAPNQSQTLIIDGKPVLRFSPLDIVELEDGKYVVQQSVEKL